MTHDPNRVLIFDTTLRDGEQSPGASMTREEKMRIARQLERLKVDVIEAGFPASSNGDWEAVHDIARANILGMQAECADETFNIGRGLGTSINELASLLLELTGSTLSIEYRPEAQSFVTHRIGSTEKAERVLGFRATIALREGLKSVVDWRMAQRAAATAR